MTWSRRFLYPIELKDGRTIETLEAARALILSLTENQQRCPAWHEAGELLAEAATDENWVSRAQGQLTEALKTQSLL